jgi:beta-RFAP synthase
MEEGDIEVTIKTPSRLHFSMIDLRGDLGRIHGSVGVAIDNPNISLIAKKTPSLKVEGLRQRRVAEFAKIILKKYSVKGGAYINVITDVPEHSGFGSGTQLGLAVGIAISELYSLNLTVEEVAFDLNRSMRSGIGTYAFKHGGFIVDGGRKKNIDKGVPPLIFRADVPDDWLFIIGLPKINHRKSGSTEKESFNRLNLPPNHLIGEISHIVLMQMIPAILEEDSVTFGRAMTNIDYKFGEFWMDVQGGRFSHPIIEAGISFLLENGALGVGQSSWGPAFYGLVKGQKQASILRSQLSEFLNSNGKSGEAFVAVPNNKGAIITVSKN